MRRYSSARRDAQATYVELRERGHGLEAIRTNKPELMAAAAVDRPVPSLRVMVVRYRGGAPLARLAANLAAFVGLDPARDAARVAALVAPRGVEPTTRRRTAPGGADDAVV